MGDEARPVVVIGAPGGDHLLIRPLGRQHPGAGDYWDGNWIVSVIEVRVGGFRGEVGASLRADEFHEFSRQLGRLYASLQGDAVLDSMEDWITLRVTATSGGRLEVTGRVLDRAGNGNELIFALDDLDQSYLPAVLSGLDDIQRAYPVLGENPAAEPPPAVPAIPAEEA